MNKTPQKWKMDYTWIFIPLEDWIMPQFQILFQLRIESINLISFKVKIRKLTKIQVSINCPNSNFEDAQEIEEVDHI